MAKEIVHEDFGEKIGGAKKDLWAARGLYVDDLLGMNEREADKYVKKDNVWKKPDYNALIQSGVPVDILYFRKVVRDSLNASPRYLRSDDTPEKRLARQKEYIATVRQSTLQPSVRCRKPLKRFRRSRKLWACLRLLSSAAVTVSVFLTGSAAGISGPPQRGGITR